MIEANRLHYHFNFADTRDIAVKENPEKIVASYYYMIKSEMNLLMWLQKLLLRAAPWFLI